MKINRDPRDVGNPSPPEDRGMAEEGLRNSIGLRVGQLCTLSLLALPDTPIGARPQPVRDRAVLLAGRALGDRIAQSLVQYVRQYEGTEQGDDDTAAVSHAARVFLDGMLYGLRAPGDVLQRPRGGGGGIDLLADEPTPRFPR